MQFRRAKQATGSYCGPAVFQMLVSVFGLDLDQEEMVDASGTRKVVMKVGMTLPEMARGLKKLYPDLVVWYMKNSRIEDIDRMIKRGFKVGVDWQGIFTQDEYGDDEENKWEEMWNRMAGIPSLKGIQGHYCVVLEVDAKKGYLRYADPYGHYAGKDRLVAIWEFLERWWDDRIDVDRRGYKKYVLEKRMMFVIAKRGDITPKKFGMRKLLT